jgi:general secretion pathway protein D
MSTEINKQSGRRISIWKLAIASSLSVCTVSTACFAGDLNTAAELFEGGQLVEARQTLMDLDRSSLSSDDRDRAFDLLVAVDRKIRHADPVDISLQKAALAIRYGDNREALRQASAAMRADIATGAQRSAAMGAIEQANRLSEELAPQANAAFDQALRDYDNGLYAESKAGFDSVYRSGVTLSTSQLHTIDAYREKIASLERARGEVFEIEYTPASMLDPGDVRRSGESSPRAGRVLAANHQPAGAGAEEAEEALSNDDLFSAAMQDADSEQAGQDQDQDQGDEDVISEALRFEAQRMVAEADIAYDAGQYGPALQKYNQAANVYRDYLDPAELDRVEGRIAEVGVLLEQPGAGSLIDVEQTQQLIREQSRAEFENFMTGAAEALAQGEFERARNQTAEARLRLAESRELFSEQEYEQRQARLDDLLSQIRTQEESARRAAIMTREDTLARAAAEQESSRRTEREAQIHENLDRIRALMMEHEYEKALEIVEQILFLDPNNPSAQLLRQSVEDIIVYRAFERSSRRNPLSWAKESQAIQESLYIPDSFIDYPNDWPAISHRRGEPLTYVQSAADAAVLSEMESKRLPASFADNTLEDVLDFIRTVANINMDVNWESLQNIGIERDTLVTLNLQPLPAKIVLDRVLEKVSPDSFSRANWAVNDGILVVASEEALRKNTFIEIYDIRDLLFQIPNYREVPQLNLNSVIRQGQGGGGGGIFQQATNEAGEGLTAEELLAQITDIIQTNVDFDGWQENGGDTGRIQALNDNLIITNTARNHQQISSLLRKLREIRSIQISVESRFLTVDQNFFERIGFDLDIVFNAMNSQFDNILGPQINGLNNAGELDAGSANPGILPSDLVGPFFSGDGSGQVLNWVLTNPDEVNQGMAPTYGVVGTDFVVPNPDGLSMVPAQQNSFGLVETLLGGSKFATDILTANPALGVAATFLDDIQVDFLVEATQADRRSVTLTAPRLTFTNGRYANIFVTTQQSFVSDLNPVVSTSAVAFDPDIDVVNEGFTMALGGVVSSDRRYVTLDVNLDVAQVVGFDQRTQSAVAGGTGGTQGSAIAEGTIDLPIVQVSSISTGATIPDQGTILLGGQRLTTETEVETGVPVLSKIPIINRFFTNRIQEKSELTLIILIKPTILIQNEEEEKRFPGLLDQLQSGIGDF